MRALYRFVDVVMMNKASIVGLGLCFYMGRRFTTNIQELEKNTQEKKLFDPLKAKAQIEVYKEIYNIGDGENGQHDPSSQVDAVTGQRKDTALKILQTA